MGSPEVFGVVWHDRMLGIGLTLNRPDAASAVDTAKGISSRGAEKVEAVRAVRVPEGTDTLEVLWDQTSEHAPRASQ